MAGFRGSIRDFEIANAIYAGASITFYVADGNGVKTSTLATLYAAPTGATTRSNPQVLDAEGKFASPVYIATPVVGEVVGSVVGSHSTAAIAPRSVYRGNWATATIYNSGDTIRDSSNNNYLAAAADYTSGASVAADITAGNLVLVVDVAGLLQSAEDAMSAYLSAAVADAEAAQTGAETAQGAAEAAQTAAEEAQALAEAVASGYADATEYGFGVVEVADAAALQAYADLEPGVDVQAYDANLAAIAGAAWEEGDLVQRGASALDRLAKGTEGQILKMVAGVPAWADHEHLVWQSAIVRRPASAGPTTGELFVADGSISHAVAAVGNRIRVRGSLGRSVGSGSNDDDGQAIRLKVDGSTVQTMTDWSFTNAVLNTSFEFHYAPADTSSHTYEVSAQATNSTLYTKSANWFVVEEISAEAL